jgi:RNA polymerase sigma-70 factor (ECF subfamily)
VDADDTLVQAAREGDARAVEALVRRYQLRIFNHARALTCDDGEAEDLAQETFIRAFRGLKRFRGESSFKNWLYRIATNVARTHLDRRAKGAPVWRTRLEGGDERQQHLASGDASVEDSVIRRDAIDRALSTLSEELRVAVVLHDLDGLEYREIAKVLEVPVGTVMSRIFRARQRLRPMLEPFAARQDASAIARSDS